MRVNLMTAVMTAALFTAPALAQTTAPATPPASPAPAPAMTAPAPAPTAAAAPAGAITKQEMGQYLASKMPGVDVRNSSNEKIGDIADLVMDKDGKISAVIISVGGFLGMGKHDVAVPLAEVKFMHEDVTTTRTSSTTTTTTPMAPATPAAPATAPRTEPTTTGTVATTSTAPAPRAYPSHVVVNMTAEQLKAAPAFKYAN